MHSAILFSIFLWLSLYFCCQQKHINKIFIQNNFVSYNKRVDVWLVSVGYSHWRINICDFNNDFWIIFSDLNETFGKKNPGWGKWLKITQNYFFQLLLNLFYHWEKSRIKDYMNYELQFSYYSLYWSPVSNFKTFNDFSRFGKRLYSKVISFLFSNILSHFEFSVRCFLVMPLCKFFWIHSVT